MILDLWLRKKNPFSTGNYKAIKPLKIVTNIWQQKSGGNVTKPIYSKFSAFYQNKTFCLSNDLDQKITFKDSEKSEFRLKSRNINLVFV